MRSTGTPLAKPIILIGPICNDPAESVSAVNKSFVAGLTHRFRFTIAQSNRKYGASRQSRLNFWNLYYLIKHTFLWGGGLIFNRPAIAHYSISAGAALWKGLLFLGMARAFGARTVGHLHSGGFIRFWEQLSPRQRQFATRRLQRLDAFVVLSEEWRQTIAEKTGLSKSRIIVVNNPINPEFECEALKFPAGRPGSVLLSLGIMSRDKGVLDLIAAAGMLRAEGRDFRLIIAGPEREPGILAQVTGEIARLDLTSLVDVRPSVHGSEKLELFRRASISVLPSYYENFPLVVLEAAAAGHAIITTPVGAVPEFFADGSSAVFFEPGDTSGLALAMKKLLDGNHERMRLARAAREVFAKDLSRDRIMASLADAYLRILSPTT